MYSACCCCALSMVENESRNIFFDVFPMFQIEFRLNLLSLFNLKKKKLKKRKRWWGRHELAIVHKSNPVCVTIGRSVILCCAWCFSSQSRARFYFSLLVFFFFVLLKASRSILLHCGASSEFIRSNYRWRGARTKGADWWNAIGRAQHCLFGGAWWAGKFETRRDGPDDSKIRLLAHSLVAAYYSHYLPILYYYLV